MKNDKANYRELLIGAGNARQKTIKGKHATWQNLTTLDIDPNCKPDVIHDLHKLPLPFEEDTFDEIHAYEVLEHVGTQGDWHFFFAQFSDFWRILKPKGILVGTSPAYNSPWAWGDPGHSRIINLECFVFLNQPEYTKQIGKTSMTDYRSIYRADFDIIFQQRSEHQTLFGLQAVKPSRYH